MKGNASVPDHKDLNDDKIKEFGRQGVVYFKQLMEDGIDMQSALEMSVQFVRTLMIMWANESKPKEPWET
jgi:hypothetical protein